jgi:hypothetical protein
MVAWIVITAQHAHLRVLSDMLPKRSSALPMAFVDFTLMGKGCRRQREHENQRNCNNEDGLLHELSPFLSRNET